MNKRKAIERFVILFLILGMVSSQINFTAEISKKTFTVGENVTANFSVHNSGNEKMKFSCILVFDPPTSKNPGCKTIDITLEPGESYSGTIGEIAEFSGATEAKIILVDSNDNALEEQKFQLEVNFPNEDKCGNAKCDENENYNVCPVDCMSGLGDGYCDEVKDDKCDPDCLQSEDPDCKKKEETPYLLYLSLLVLSIIVFAAVLLYFKRKKGKKVESGEKEDKIKEWIKEKLQEGEKPEVLKKGLIAEGYDPKIVDDIGRGH